ncbi:MAG: GreA/GreB family elongation factor [Bacteroidetes bacterium]|nr:GreA/GreB family elongation factor [Bacteroidota bacterium]
MSRGFVKEDDQEEAPFVPPRAALPDGVTNYVTPRGLRLLLEERARLEQERASVPGGEDERRREQAVIDGRLALLQERILTARLVEQPDEAPTEIRFGTTVTFTYLDGPQRGTTRTFTLVGVDEASVAEQRIAFTSPLARTLLGRHAGDTVPFATGAAQQRIEVRSITADGER